MKRLMIALVVLAAALSISKLVSAEKFREFPLFIGGNTDSTEQVSNWVPVRYAKRVYIRTWSTHAGFSVVADSMFSDSLTSFIVQFSDSIIGRTAGQFGNLIASAADSIIVPMTIVGDTTKTMTAVYPLPINKPLRGATNGSGLVTVVFPTRPGSVASTTPIDEGGIIIKGFMRVRALPLRRNTAATSEATVTRRVTGLKGFKMTATVVEY